ncbi:MAG: hypothetical protein LBO77_06830 [Desulfovibrio sp.]|jgi:hypothetical protein|nr:hypothetical protein [Desulfovibrio sp.]
MFSSPSFSPWQAFLATFVPWAPFDFETQPACGQSNMAGIFPESEKLTAFRQSFTIHGDLSRRRRSKAKTTFFALRFCRLKLRLKRRIAVY